MPSFFGPAASAPYRTQIIAPCALGGRARSAGPAVRMPTRWLLLPVALTAMLGVYATFKTLLGRDAGVAMLVLLLTFKLLEMHAKRDLFVVIFLSFFLMLASFFYSQTMLNALLTVVAVITLLTAQLSFQYPARVPPLRRRLQLAAAIVGLAA